MIEKAGCDQPPSGGPDRFQWSSAAGRRAWMGSAGRVPRAASTCGRWLTADQENSRLGEVRRQGLRSEYGMVAEELLPRLFLSDLSHVGSVAPIVEDDDGA